MKKFLAACVLLCLVFSFASSFPAKTACADILKLRSGGELEVKILEESATDYKVRTLGGTEYFMPKNQVLSVVKKPFPPDIFDEKFAKLEEDGADADTFFELGLWAEESKMRSCAEKAFEKVLELDGDHAKLREKMGQISFEGDWMTPEERDAIVAQRDTDAEAAAKAKFEAEQRAKGLELWGGKWLPKGDVEHLKKGEVKYRGKWMTPAEKVEMIKMETEGVVVSDKQPVEEATGKEYQIRKSLHFVVVSDATDSDNIQYVQGWEKAYRWVHELFELKDDVEIFMGRAIIYTPDTSEDAVNIFQKLLGGGSQRSVNHVKGGGSHYSTQGLYEICSRRGSPHGQQVINTTHSVGHMLFCGVVGSHSIPWWISESMAMMIQNEVLGGLGGYCFTWSTGRKPIRDLTGADVLSMAKAQAQGDGGTPLVYLFGRGINSLTPEDNAKSYTILQMMIEKDKKKFIAFCRGMRGVDQRNSKKAQIALVKKIWDQTPEQLEKEWSEWVLVK